MPSREIKEGIERMPHRALLLSTGISPKSFKKPFIGIASSFSDIVPGHVGMRDLERFIERGVEAAGGVPFCFGVPSICDGISMGHQGMRFSLPLRELVADAIECVARAHSFDGLILLTGCDKITPGMLMACARLNIPSLVVTAGPMLSGRYKGRRLSLVRDTFEAVGRFKRGEISQKEFLALEREACPGAGSCQGIYTANTMACLTEALGLSLPGCGTSLCVSAKKRRIAYESGERIVEMVKENLTPREILKEEAFENAIRVDMALGGSTNTVLHLLALAKEAGVSLSLSKFDELARKTPWLVPLRPGGDYFMEDMEWAGGVPALLNRLQKFLKESITCTGKSIKEIAKEGEVWDEEVIREVNNPVRKEGGIAVLWGSLAPEGAVVKQTAVSPSMRKFRGRAKIFNGEGEALEALFKKKIKEGDIIVIRYEGPKGGPGMPEMLSPTSLVVGMGLSEGVALLTDGRFSGGTRGPCIGHISPEAAEAGPIGLLEEGDPIFIDIEKRKLEVEVPPEELKRRKKYWKKPPLKVKEGYLRRYSELVSSASKGAVLRKE